jgi:hypothetical protein
MFLAPVGVLLVLAWVRPTLLVSKSYAADYVLETLGDHTQSDRSSSDLRWLRLYGSKLNDPTSNDTKVVLASALIDLCLSYQYGADISQSERDLIALRAGEYLNSSDPDVMRIGELLKSQSKMSFAIGASHTRQIEEVSKFLRRRTTTR